MPKRNPHKTAAPLVSVIIPCFNRDIYLRETIDSVLAQTYPQIELIAVDDGSTDGTHGILESYGSKLILLEHPGRVNRGQSAAVNLGLRQAKGEFIALLDSDDLFLPDKIARQVAFLDRHPDVGLVYANGHAIDQHGEILYEIYPNGHREYSDPKRVLLDCYFLLPNNALVRKAAFDKAGKFDESLRAAQDHDMAIRISEVTRLAYLDEHLFCYRRHPDSISAKHADIRWRNGLLILKKAARRYPYPHRTIRRRRAVLYFRLGQCALEKGRYIEGGLICAAAGVLDPLRAFKVISGREQMTSPH